MLTNQRHAEIISFLEGSTTATVEQLCRHLYASASTVRRDLSQLEQQGFLRRVHGGAVLTTGSGFEPPAFLQSTRHLAEKQHIAQLATRFLKNSCTYFFASSSTTTLLAAKLTDYLDVKLATNSLDILSSVQSSANLSVISCGGYLRSPYGEFTGNLALRTIEQLNADVFFFSCNGFSLAQGCSEFSDENVAVKRAFYRQAKQRILLCDHTKFERQAFFSSFSLSEIDYIITDRAPENCEYLEVLGKRLIY